MSKNFLALEDSFSVSTQDFIKNNDSVSETLTSQLKSWEVDTKQKLGEEFPLLQSEAQHLESARLLLSGSSSTPEYERDLSSFGVFLEKARLPRDLAFWNRTTNLKPSTLLEREFGIKPKPVDISIKHKLLLQEWRKKLDQKRSEWELQVIQQLREQYLKQIEEWIEKLKKIVDSLQNMGLEPGYFLDFSEGGLSLSDLEQVQKWAKYLSDDKGVKDLCELLGKVRQVSLAKKVELAKTVTSIPVTIPDVNSREEIVGIKLGKDIEHLLPSELALLSDSDTSLLFDLKYIESRLMCFDMQGMQTQSKEIEIEEEQQVSEEDKMGPIVICVDTSGSMHGSPETIAKAVTLFMATKAKQAKRACYLINFSTGIETLDLSDGYSLQTLLKFLQKSFHGGTDVAPAITHGLEIMEKDDYQNADMLIISDFVMSSLSGDMLEAIESQRTSGNRFYSLCIGNEFMSNRLRSHFDREWIYNPSSSSIHELIGFQEGLLEEAVQA